MYEHTELKWNGGTCSGTQMIINTCEMLRKATATTVSTCTHLNNSRHLSQCFNKLNGADKWEVRGVSERGVVGHCELRNRHPKIVGREQDSRYLVLELLV